MSWFNHHRTQLGSGAPAGNGPLRRESVIPGPGGMLPGAGPAMAPQAGQLHFTVQYGLPEYVSFMWQHAGYIIRRRRIGRMATWWMLSKSTSAAAMHFVALRRSRNLYDFTIDEHGIIRTSGTGVTLVPWGDVSAIRRYTRGFMLVLKRGTLPIPFRCLNPVQTGVMEAFAATLRATRR